MTLPTFLRLCPAPPRLTRAVIRQMGGWEWFRHHAKIIALGGVSGMRGFSTQEETVAFYRRNRADIFRLEQFPANDETSAAFAQLLAWRAVGRIAKSLVELSKTKP